MSDSDGERGASGTTRRRYLKYTGIGAIAGLAGCTGGQGGDGATSDTSTGTTDAAGTTTSQSSGADEFVIGSNHPLSGSLAYTGVSMERAMKMAAEQKNADGGIESLGGAEVRILSGDNQGKQQLGAQVEQQLISDGADVVTGCFSSNVTMPATGVAEQEGVPHVITVAASRSILYERGFDYVYRLQPTTYHYGRDWADYFSTLVRDAGHEIETVGHYYINDSYGSEIHQYVEQFVPENDMELVESTPVTSDMTSATSQVTQLQEADPDCICLTGRPHDAGLFFEALNSLDYRPTWISGCANNALVDPSQAEELGERTVGLTCGNYALNPNNPLTSEFTEQYRGFADRGASPEAALAWAATQLIFDAVERAGTTDSEALNEAIANTTMDSEDTPLAMPGVEFQDNGENALAASAMNQIQDDYSIEVVYPEDYAAVSPTLTPGET